MAKKAQPTTDYAKADAALQATCRKVYPRYDEDVAAFGRPVADYNAGFAAGDANGRRDLAKLVAALLTKHAGK